MNDDVRALVAEGADYVRAALRELEKELETARWKGDDEERGKRRIQRGKQPHNIWYPKRESGVLAAVPLSVMLRVIVG